MKKLVSFVVVSLVLLSSAAAASLKSKSIQTVMDGESAKSIKLYHFANHDYFSIKDIAGLYGARLDWRPVSGTVRLLMHNRRLDIGIKSRNFSIDNAKKKLALPTRQAKGDLFVPKEFILSHDFAGFSETSACWNPDACLLTVDRKVNLFASRFYTYADHTRIVIELLEDMSYTWTQKSAGKVVIAFPRGRVKEEKVDVDDGVVKSIVSGNDGRLATVTITFADTAGAVRKTVLQKPSRLVVDVARARTAGGETPLVSRELVSSGTITAEVPEPPAATAAATEAVQETVAAAVASEPASARQVYKKKKIVILDAGHGGEDPGAVGPGGTKEKDINLAIVYELKRLFEEDDEFTPILTRTDDTFIPLVERTSFANEKKADMFVAVHCNANDSRAVNGFEIYFLNEKASDSDAAATAVLENSVVRFEGKPPKKRARLQELLWSMTVNEFINESAELCSFIAGEVPRRAKVENRGVKQAGFFVLKGAQMPATLVECAFLSNYAEEAKLKTKRFQSYLADSIYEGVRRYYLRKETVNVKK